MWLTERGTNYTFTTLLITYIYHLLYSSLSSYKPSTMLLIAIWKWWHPGTTLYQLEIRGKFGNNPPERSSGMLINLVLRSSVSLLVKIVCRYCDTTVNWASFLNFIRFVKYRPDFSFPPAAVILVAEIKDFYNCSQTGKLLVNADCVNLPNKLNSKTFGSTYCFTGGRLSEILQKKTCFF